MNERSSPFQLILMVIAGALAVVGIVTFAFFRAKTGDKGYPVVAWGPFPQDVVDEVLRDLQAEGVTKGNITYVEKRPDELDRALVEAIADNVAPDLVILEAGQLFGHAKRLVAVPYKSLPVRTLRETYAGADAFAAADGVLGVPLLVDPLVLYYNSARFASAGVALTPTHWDQVLSVTPSLTKLAGARALERSAIALGEYGNVEHAKEIFFALAHQAGADVFARDIGEDEDGKPVDQYRVELAGRQGAAAPPATAALMFFAQFADPSKQVYTWNVALPPSRERFVSGDLAMYLGFASERAGLREVNPNLPFDLAPIPQSRAAEERSTYGRFYAASIVRTSKSPGDAYAAAVALTSDSAQRSLAAATGMAPSVRAILDSPDASRTDAGVVYGSAIMARPMLEPDADETSAVVERMMRNVSSGRTTADEAVSRAQRELEVLFGADPSAADGSI